MEPPGGSPARAVGPFVAGHEGDPERSLWFWSYNRGKRSVVLDLDSAAGQDELRRLARQADLVIESEAPGVMAAHGLGPDDLASDNPALVYTSVTPFGQTGPKAGWAATDLTVVAAGMQLVMMGDEDRAPVRIPLDQAFLHAGPTPPSVRWSPCGSGPAPAGASTSTCRPRPRCSRPPSRSPWPSCTGRRPHPCGRWHQGGPVPRAPPLAGGRRSRVDHDPVRRGHRTVRQAPVRLDPRRGRVRRSRPGDRLAQLRRRRGDGAHPGLGVRPHPGRGRRLHRPPGQGRPAAGGAGPPAADRAHRHRGRRGRLRAVRRPWVLASHRGPGLGRAVRFPGPFAQLSATPLDADRPAPTLGADDAAALAPAPSAALVAAAGPGRRRPPEGD